MTGPTWGDTPPTWGEMSRGKPDEPQGPVDYQNAVEEPEEVQTPEDLLAAVRKHPYAPKFCRTKGCNRTFLHEGNCDVPTSSPVCPATKCRQPLGHEGWHDSLPTQKLKGKNNATSNKPHNRNR